MLQVMLNSRFQANAAWDNTFYLKAQAKGALGVLRCMVRRAEQQRALRSPGEARPACCEAWAVVERKLSDAADGARHDHSSEGPAAFKRGLADVAARTVYIYLSSATEDVVERDVPK